MFTRLKHDDKVVRSGFSNHGIHHIEGVMYKEKYYDILQLIVSPCTKWILPIQFLFQHDNDPKVTLKLVKNYKIEVSEWPAQTPDLNPIENLWEVVEKKIRGKKFKNRDLFQEIQTVSRNVDDGILHNLIESLCQNDAVQLSKIIWNEILSFFFVTY